MEIRKLSPQSPYLKTVAQIYRESFPKEERIPTRMLLRRVSRPFVDLWGIFDHEDLQGFAYVILGEKNAYLYFFAIAAEARGRGMGARFLRELIFHYENRCFFLALEQPDESAENYQQRLRRYAFYRRCGLNDLPCNIQERSCVFNVMGTGGTVSKAEYEIPMRAYLGFIPSILYPSKLLPKNTDT